MGACPHCGQKVPFMEAFPPGRADRCSSCGRDLRNCLACKNYDRTAYNECRETNADRVVDKEKANFCEWFKFGPSAASSGPTKEDLLAKARDLFKK